jgi:hypothetical protein
VKAGLERELGRLVLNCTACGFDVRWVALLAANSRTISARQRFEHRTLGLLLLLAATGCDVRRLRHRDDRLATIVRRFSG